MPLTMPSFLRRSQTASVDSVEEEVAVEEQPTELRRRARTPSKKELGLVTPKRKGGVRVAPKAPADKKEARKQAREQVRQQRAENRAGMMAGKEEYLLPRDKGPERRLVRNLIDSRRNAAGFFMPAAFLLILLTSEAFSPSIRLAANLMWVAVAIAVIIDSVVMSRRIKKLVLARFPKTTQRMRSLYWYGIMRSISFRKMRIPAPQVKYGDKI